MLLGMGSDENSSPAFNQHPVEDAVGHRLGLSEPHRINEHWRGAFITLEVDNQFYSKQNSNRDPNCLSWQSV